ncbi:helix-turn-helix domain-containing protein [Novosphingobium sp. PS1R-30]|uniref:Helix-turn-helix domain-containing protein n=1 Tax=Novosphingobium anseongense TaxID=3133436 RepID=A0ABU8RRX1_9SPHN
MTLIASRSPRSPSAHVRVKRPGDRRSLSRSATRALDVLELFGRERRPLRAVEISHTLGTHPSTTNQLLKTMLDSGHLAFDARAKTYLPSPRLAEFSAWIMASYGADGRLRDLIDAVHAATGMTVTISTPNDLFMQLIDCTVASGERGERGLSVSVFGSAIGSAYLASLDDDEVLRLADRARVPAGDVPGVLQDLAQIRLAGFADGATAGSDYWSLAMPLPLRALQVPTVLGLAGSAAQVRERLGELHVIMREAVANWAPVEE